MKNKDSVELIEYTKTQDALNCVTHALGAVLGAAVLVGAPSDIVSAAAVGAGSPLWFLAAYLLCQALVPPLFTLHTRAPRATVIALFAGVVLVDVVRFSTGIAEVGLLNLLFVWPLAQQLGFWYRDGWFARRSPLTLVVIAVACYAMLWPLTAWGPYSTSMLDNLNPPTLPLVLLGLAQHRALARDAVAAPGAA